MWVREEALSRVESAALYTRPERDEEMLDVGDSSSSTQEKVIEAFLKLRASLHIAIRSLASSIVNPVSSAHNAGSALHSSVKLEAKALRC